MGLIPPETIEEVLAATDIVELVGSYFPLKRAGNTYQALCPFHNERTPSFLVNPSRNTFHCFGCHKGGSAIRFVMEYENLPFPEAVRKLADQAGIRIAEEATDGETVERNRKRKRLLAVHRDVAKWYHRILLEAKIAEPTREYLRNRGFSDEAVERWQVGYAPADNGALLKKWAQKYDHAESVLLESGLLSVRDESKPTQGNYARFRDRVMFPIANDYGDVIAFSGRILQAGASPAKYMNSPETPIFSKSRTLYGFEKSKRAIAKADQAIVCEGQIDLIMCFEQGVENVIAPLGTAFTPDHARMIRRQTDEVVLCYDSDNAGVQAAGRAFAELAKANVFVRVASVPQGKDPDEYIRNHGIESFREVIESAREFVDFQIDLKTQSIDMSNTRDRVRFAGEMAQIIAMIDDKVAFETAIQKVSTRLGIAPIEYHRQVSALVRRNLNQKHKPSTVAPSGDAPPQESPRFEINDPVIRMLCTLALTNAQARSWLQSEENTSILASMPQAAPLQDLLTSEVDVGDAGKVSAFLSQLTPEEESVFNQLLAVPVPAEAALETAQTVFRRLVLDSLKRRYEELSAQLRSGGLAPERVIQLTREIQELGKEIQETKQG
jgi:DNA primase